MNNKFTEAQITQLKADLKVIVDRNHNITEEHITPLMKEMVAKVRMDADELSMCGFWMTASEIIKNHKSQSLPRYFYEGNSVTTAEVKQVINEDNLTELMDSDDLELAFDAQFKSSGFNIIYQGEGLFTVVKAK